MNFSNSFYKGFTFDLSDRIKDLTYNLKISFLDYIISKLICKDEQSKKQKEYFKICKT